MPAQSLFLVSAAPPAQAPGAVVLTADELDGSNLLSIINEGPRSVVVSLANLQTFLAGPFGIPSRVVTTNALAVFSSTDVALLINKTVAGATPITLPTPALSRMVLIKDMKGDAGTNNITLNAGTGKTINGAQTLVMAANYGTTMLLGMSSTQWGTLI